MKVGIVCTMRIVMKEGMKSAMKVGMGIVRKLGRGIVTKVGIKIVTQMLMKVGTRTGMGIVMKERREIVMNVGMKMLMKVFMGIVMKVGMRIERAVGGERAIDGHSGGRRKDCTVVDWTSTPLLQTSAILHQWQVIIGVIIITIKTMLNVDAPGLATLCNLIDTKLTVVRSCFFKVTKSSVNDQGKSTSCPRLRNATDKESMLVLKLRLGGFESLCINSIYFFIQKEIVFEASMVQFVSDGLHDRCVTVSDLPHNQVSQIIRCAHEMT